MAGKSARKTGTDVAPQRSGVPSTRAERLSADAGKGVSTNRDDKIIPMIRVLQTGSPQCLKQKAEHIKGAEAGDFFFKNMLVPLVKGDKGFDFIPCAFLRCWLEFDGPRDDNPKFIRRHEDDNGRPKGVAGLELAEDGYDFENKDGHRFTFSREFYGLADGRPFMFPFGGSGHTTAREWQTLMEQFQLSDGRVEPSFNRAYKITSVPKTNESGDWFGVRFEHIDEVSDKDYDLGLALHNAVMGGAVRGEAPDIPAADDGKKHI